MSTGFIFERVEELEEPAEVETYYNILVVMQNHITTISIIDKNPEACFISTITNKEYYTHVQTQINLALFTLENEIHSEEEFKKFFLNLSVIIDMFNKCGEMKLVR